MGNAEIASVSQKMQMRNSGTTSMRNFASAPMRNSGTAYKSNSLPHMNKMAIDKDHRTHE